MRYKSAAGIAKIKWCRLRANGVLPVFVAVCQGGLVHEVKGGSWMIRIEVIVAIPADFDNLVQQSEAEGFGFVRRLKNDWKAGKNRFNRSGEFLLAARDDGQPIGICGINIDPYTTERGVARLRHLYVLPAYRSTGIGSRIVKQCVGNLHPAFRLVRLRVPNAATGRFYEKLGFRAIDDESTTHRLDIR